MNYSTYNIITNFISEIPDDASRNICAREKYLDIIVPMTEIRCLNRVLEGTNSSNATQSFRV